MPRAHLLALPLVVALAVATPAHASTIPDAGLKRGQVAVTAGFLDGSVDWSPIDRLQVGAGGYFTLAGAGTYGRLTYHLLGATPIGDVGFHVAGGTYSPVLAKSAGGLFAFAGPVVAWPLGAVTLRASLGLIATNAHNLTYDPTKGPPQDANITSRSWGLGVDNHGLGVPGFGPFVPNLEVAFRLHPHHELTLGGNAIIGWRGRFGGS